MSRAAFIAAKRTARTFARTARLAAERGLRLALASVFLLGVMPVLPASATATGLVPLAVVSNPGTLVIDYPGGFSAGTLAKMKAAGVGIVLRYVADAKWKSLTRSEANALRANAIDIAIVYESNSKWMLGGRKAGIAAAKKAKAAVISLGGPKQPFIYFACDTATRDYATVNACLAGAASVMGGARYVGVYGSYSVCDSALKGGYAAKAWQTEAWSYGQLLPACAIFQPAHRAFGNLGLDYDTDYARTEDIGQWGYVPPGSVWTTPNSSTAETLTATRFVSASTGTAVGANGAVLRTTDGGASWSPAASSGGASLSAVDFADDATGCAVGAGGALVRTTDGGATWAPVAGPAAGNLRGISFATAAAGSAPATAVAVGDAGAVERSTDGGASWTALASPTGAALNAIDFVTSASAWAVGEGGTILHSNTSGSSWSAASVPTTATLTAVNFIEPNFGWAVGENGTILRTTNGGYTWKAQSSATTATLTGVRFSDSQSGWAVGEGGTVLRTVDGGMSWVRQSCATTATLTGLWTTPDGRTAWVVGAGGTILRATATGGSSFGSISGVVSDAKTGAALSGMVVTLGNKLMAPTASDGSFVIARVTPGTKSLTFSSGRYISHTNTGLVLSAGVRSRLIDKLTPKTVTSLSVPQVSVPTTVTSGITTIMLTMSPAAAGTSAVTKLIGVHRDAAYVKKKVGKKTVKVKVWVWREKFSASMGADAAGTLKLVRSLTHGRWSVHAAYPGTWKYLPSSSATVTFVVP